MANPRQLTRAVLIHGMHGERDYENLELASPSNRHWFPWAQKQLTARGILAQTPEMPTPYAPVYERWRETFEQFKLDQNTLLVGHSLGGGFLLRWLSEHPEVRVGQIILVAPWLDVEKTIPAHGGADFFAFQLDPNLANRAAKLTVFESDNDMPEIQSSEQKLRAEVPGLTIKTIPGAHHFREIDGYREFPQLIAEILD